MSKEAKKTEIIENQKELHPLARVEELNTEELKLTILITVDDFFIIKRYLWNENEREYLFCEMEITPR